MPAVATTDPKAEGGDDAGSAPSAGPDPEQPPQPAPSDEAAADAPALDLINAQNWLSPADARWLGEMGRRALGELRQGAPVNPGGEVRARLVDDAEMARLHLDYLSDPSTTDVLTFDHADDPDAPLDVDLALCVDEARRQASAIGVELKCELLLYLVHGALHCLGYDDNERADHERMHRREDDVLRAVGVGAIYAPGRAPDRAAPGGEP